MYIWIYTYIFVCMMITIQSLVSLHSTNRSNVRAVVKVTVFNQAHKAFGLMVPPSTMQPAGGKLFQLALR